MEQWKKEITALEEKRKRFGLSFYQLEKMTGVNRQQLKKIFEFVNIPSIKLFFEVKDVLDNYKDVNNIEVTTTTDENSFDENELSLERPKFPDDRKEKKFFISNPIAQVCDCKLVDGLLRRGKIKCTKTKNEHNF